MLDGGRAGGEGSFGKPLREAPVDDGLHAAVAHAPRPLGPCGARIGRECGHRRAQHQALDAVRMAQGGKARDDTAHGKADKVRARDAEAG
jgi:hypothetical protein